MDKKQKQALFLITFGVILYAAVMHFDQTLSFLSGIGRMVFPIAAGMILAFILNVPVNGFDRLLNRVFSKAKHKPKRKTVQLTSLILTLLCACLIIVLLFTTVIPEVSRTLKSILVRIEEQWPTWLAILEKNNIDTSLIKQWLNSFDVQALITKVASSAGVVIGSIAGMATSTVSVLMTCMTSFIIAIYVLMSKDTLGNQVKKVLYAYVKTPVAEKVHHIAKLIQNAYTKYLSGQCVESVILGLLMFAAFTVFRLPYAGLVAFVTAIFAMVPYIGSLIACILGVFLTLLESPQKALLCLVVYQVVQFVENQFIYPHVVGGSVGLSPLWTLIAVFIGGQLFGLVGMIFFIPLAAVAYELLRESTNQRLSEKNISLSQN